MIVEGPTTLVKYTDFGEQCITNLGYLRSTIQRSSTSIQRRQAPSKALCNVQPALFVSFASDIPSKVGLTNLTYPSPRSRIRPIITINITQPCPIYNPFPACSIQPRPTANNPPLCLLRQTRKHTETQVQIRSQTSHTAIHDFHIHTPVVPNSRIKPRNPNHFPTQRIIIRIRARRGGIKDDMRHSTDRFCGGILVATGSIARAWTVVCKISREDPSVCWQR